MSCNAFRREWEPGGSDAHAASCPVCGEWLAAQRDLASGLSRLAAQLVTAQAPSHEAELRAAFRGSHRNASRRPLGRFVGWAAAAGFVGLVVLVMRWPHPSAVGKRTQAVTPAPAIVPPAAKPRPSSEPTRVVRHPGPRTAPGGPSVAAPPPLEDPGAEAVAASAPLPAHDRSDPAPEVEVAETDATESARPAREQSFYPLLPDREPSAIESGQIVRVQLRPDVLSAAGLASRAPGSGPVEAEVLMGPDGVALGIRLARPKR
jgi:hypothetical protein